jgi:hypothetical protein
MALNPYQVANDMAAQAQCFAHDADIGFVCRNCAWMIRKLQAGQSVERSLHAEVQRRYLEIAPMYRDPVQSQIGKSLERGMGVLATLWAEVME